MPGAFITPLRASHEPGTTRVDVSRGPSTPVVKRISARGARMARRDDQACTESVREEQPSRPGCPARKALDKWRGQTTGCRSDIEHRAQRMRTDLHAVTRADGFAAASAHQLQNNGKN